MIRKCILKPHNSLHQGVPLPHKTEVFVGRDKVTQIKDQSCSRKQLSLKADCVLCSVELKQLGGNTSGLNGFATLKSNTYQLKHGDLVEILLNQYPYTIEFDPPPDDARNTSIKTKRESSTEKSPKKIKLSGAKPSNDKYPNNTVAEENIWESVDNGNLHIYTPKGLSSKQKIAAFDMDGTLIKTKSGKVFPIDAKDWQLAFHNVPQKLQEQFENDYKVVIFTNQAGIGKGNVKIDEFKAKVEAILGKIKVPIQVFVSTGKGVYRKPNIGMWTFFIDEKNRNVSIDLGESFFCGDAAGRIAKWAPGKKKDHSLADRLFAQNIGLKFYTPEEFFMGAPHNESLFMKPEFDPKNVVSEPFNEALISDDQEILVMVGYPGSGKTFLSRTISHRSGGKYQIVCRDELNSWQKCASEAKKIILGGKSVIVDSTNPDIESRSRWISLAKELKVKARCVRMETDFAHARHNNRFRELTDKKHLPVTDIVFYGFRNKFKEPSKEEGFAEVIKAKFSPQFDNDELEKIYYMHLLEK